MQFKQLKALFSIGFLVTFGVQLNAQGTSGQNFTGSPFSSYGLGEWTGSNFLQANTAMNTHSGYYSYSLYNPATLGSVRYTTLDLSGGYKEGLITSGSQQQSFTGGGLNYLSLAFPVWKYLKKEVIGYDSAKKLKRLKYVPYGAASSLVLKPLTTVGYAYFLDNDKGSLPTRTSYRGTGGIDVFQWNLGFRLANKLNIGYGLGYVFGSLKENSLFSVPDSLSLGVVEDSKVNVIRGIQQQFGLLANFKLDSTYHKIGLSYEMYSGLSGTQNQLTRNLEVFGGYTSIMDTIYINNGVKKDFTMPTAIGIGYGFQFRRAFSLNFDLRKQVWGNVNTFFDKTKHKDRMDYGVSLVLNPVDEKAPNERKMKPPIRFGYVYSTTQNVYSYAGAEHQVIEQRMSVGFGLPFVQRYYDNSVITNMVNVNIQYLTRGFKVGGMPSEQYLVLGLGLQLGDIWFAKRKYD